MPTGPSPPPYPEVEASPASARLSEPRPSELLFPGLGACLIWATGAVGCFQLAYRVPQLSFLILVYAVCLVQLARAATTRQSFYFGLGVGLLNTALLMDCLWRIFGPPAVSLWFVLAFWTALFAALARTCLVRVGRLWGCLLIPFVWTGLEYFRSELYYLRFSWLNVGYALSGTRSLPLFHVLGIYGIGFIAIAGAAVISFLRPKKTALLVLLLAVAVLTLAIIAGLSGSHQFEATSSRNARVAGVQLEFPIAAEVVSALNKLVQNQPTAQLLVLSEYTFDGEVPEKIKSWCRENKRYLIVGGKDPAPRSNFYDTGVRNRSFRRDYLSSG
jgi:apolipoprotein N-acyltransferase